MKTCTNNKNGKRNKITGAAALFCLVICLTAALAGCAREQASSGGTAAGPVTDSSIGTSAALDNFSVDSKAVRAFAEKVQAAVKDEDLEALSSLMTFPNYVSIYTQNNGMVKSEDGFLSLGKEKIFTDQLKASIANADIAALKPSMAGFVLVSADDESAPSITFGIQNGELKIVGMNY